MIPRRSPRNAQSVLGLALGRDRVAAAELRRANGTVEVRASLDTALGVDLLADEPAKVAAALRQALESAGICERRCTVALPHALALSLAVDVPDLPEADRESFLQIEAERGFPQAPDDLLLQSSTGTAGPGGQTALLVAFPRHAVERLESILRLARLQPVSFTLDSAALHPPSNPALAGVLALIPAGNALALQLNHAGAVAAVRIIDDVLSGDPARPECRPDHLHRELRITLGQLPAGVRDHVRQIRLLGDSPAAEAAANALGPIAQRLGLTLERTPSIPGSDPALRWPANLPASPALAVAAQSIAGIPPTFEFLPPRISAWQQFSQRYASRRLAVAGAVAGAVAAVVAILFLGQQVLLWRWQGRWDAIKTHVARLESMQKEIRLYRPWFDDSCRSLAILRRLTESFPEDGSVSAKTVEIRPNGRVICSGAARDTQSWLRMLDQMRNARGITDVQVEQVRGKSPLEFTFNFRWEGAGGS